MHFRPHVAVGVTAHRIEHDSQAKKLARAQRRQPWLRTKRRRRRNLGPTRCCRLCADGAVVREAAEQRQHREVHQIVRRGERRAAVVAEA